MIQDITTIFIVNESKFGRRMLVSNTLWKLPDRLGDSYNIHYDTLDIERW